MAGVLITGASGFIGGSAARRFRAGGWNVIAPSRERFDLSRSFDARLLDGVDVVLHAALANGDNLAGSKELARAASARGVRCIFISSFAARPDALSRYGREKFAAESFFANRDAIVRPGLVVGAGGLFGRLVAHLHTSAVIPLIDGGNQPLQTIYIDDLVDAIERLAKTPTDVGTYDLAEQEPLRYHDAIVAICAHFGIRPRLVPMPFWMARLGLRAWRRLGLRAPIEEEQLLGLRALARRDTTRDATRLGIRPRTLAESLRALDRFREPTQHGNNDGA